MRVPHPLTLVRHVRALILLLLVLLPLAEPRWRPAGRVFVRHIGAPVGPSPCPGACYASPEALCSFGSPLPGASLRNHCRAPSSVLARVVLLNPSGARASFAEIMPVSRFGFSCSCSARGGLARSPGPRWPFHSDVEVVRNSWMGLKSLLLALAMALAPSSDASPIPRPNPHPGPPTPHPPSGFDHLVFAVFWPPASLPPDGQARAASIIHRREASSGFWTHGLWPAR